MVKRTETRTSQPVQVVALIAELLRRVLEWRELRREAAARQSDPTARANHPTPVRVRVCACVRVRE